VCVCPSTRKSWSRHHPASFHAGRGSPGPGRIGKVHLAAPPAFPTAMDGGDPMSAVRGKRHPREAIRGPTPETRKSGGGANAGAPGRLSAAPGSTGPLGLPRRTSGRSARGVAAAARSSVRPVHPWPSLWLREKRSPTRRKKGEIVKGRKGGRGEGIVKRACDT